MSVPQSLAEILEEHVTLTIESLDRVYLNLYVPRLQREEGVAYFFRTHRGFPYASSALMKPISDEFITSVRAFAEAQGVEIYRFKKGQRKDDVTQEKLKSFEGKEGLLYIGVAQEKAKVIRTTRRYDRQGRPYPWLYKSTAPVNHYYFYCVDKNCGPFFIKFCSYFPYNGKLCLNGHEYAKCQLDQLGIGYEPLDNGFLSCEHPDVLQQICDDFGEDQIEDLARKWLDILPHPFSYEDQDAGYTYEISMLQVEFARTQVFGNPRVGRMFFEQIIREHLDLGRPEHVQLIFNRRVTRRTPGRFRTRVITQGVSVRLHIDYKSSRIKQYFKLDRALRTEVIINNSRDFGIGKLLKNLPVLRQIGFAANRRLLDVQKVSHDCSISEEVFEQVVRPIEVNGQRASALRFDDFRVQMLLSAVLLFSLQPYGFRRRDLQEPMAQLLGVDPGQITGGRMTYDLRRLRLHGITERIGKSYRYRLTENGLRIALYFSRVYLRLLRPGLDEIMSQALDGDSALRQIVHRADREIEKRRQRVQL